MVLSIPDVKLVDGRSMPILGLGTYSAERSGDREKTEEAVYQAIKLGYRHIDTAWVYQVEKEVGRGAKRAIDEGIVKREDLFIVTKIWMTNMTRDECIRQAKESNASLGLDYIDLLLIHWPSPVVNFEKKLGGVLPVGEDNKPVPLDDLDIHRETWPAMEETVKLGITKSIGVSNYNTRQLKELLEVAKIKPVNNQVECTPYLPQKKLIAFAKEHGITITAYSPFGGGPKETGGANLEETAVRKSLWEEEPVKTLAAKYNKTVNQILLRFHVERGVIVIPKTVTPSRLVENADIFDFSLSAEDLALLDSMENGRRSVSLDLLKSAKNYPFNEE